MVAILLLPVLQSDLFYTFILIATFWEDVVDYE